MRRLAKGMSAFTLGRSGSAAGRDACSFATRGASVGFNGSGAPAASLAAATLGFALLFALLFAPLAQAGKKVDRIVSGALITDHAGGNFSNPRGLAANATGAGPAGVGDLYVVDSGNNRIQQLSPAGPFIRAFGRDVIATNVQERQLLRISATGGSYTLTFNGSTTAPIVYNANSTNIRNALLALPSIGAGNVSVADQGSGLFLIFFNGALAPPTAGDQPQVTADGSNLTGSIQIFPLADGALVTASTGTGYELCTVASHCKAGTTSPAYGGTLSSPQGIVVSQSNGDLYVTDSSNNRLQQFAGDGTFLRAIGAAVGDGGADGTGTVTNGSTTVSSVVTTAKAFVAGQVIEGTGIAPGTTISSVGSGTITLSQAATPAATGAGTAISAPTAGGNVARNEQQTVTLSPGTGGGTYTLTYSTPNPSATSLTTAAIAHNAPASGAGSVQEALEALANIGGGNVAVTGPAGGPYTVEFKGTRFADTDVAQMTITPTGFTAAAGSQHTCSSTTTADGTSFQWLANGAPAPGAGATTATYTVHASDAGKAIQCRILKSNAANVVGSVQISNPPLLVATPSGNMPTAPGTISSPSGTANVAGDVLTCNAGSWGNAPTSYTYTWLKNGSQVLETEGPTASTSDTYTLLAADVSAPANFQCVVTAANASGSVAKASQNKATGATPAGPGAPNPAAPSGATSSPNVTVPALSATVATAVVGASASETCTTADACRAGLNNGQGGSFSSPGGIAIGPSGNLFVADTGNRRIQEIEADGDWVRAWGWDVVQPGGSGETSSIYSEIQTVSSTVFAGLGTTPPGGGSFTLTFDGQTTVPINYAADSATLTAALEALPNIGTGDISVSEPVVTSASRSWTVSFIGSLANTDVPAITGNGSSLTGGFGMGAIASTAVVPGGVQPDFEICVVASQCKAAGNPALAGANGSFAASNPAHVAVDGGGTVYASDSTDNRVERFDSTQSSAASLLKPPLNPATVTGTANTATTGLAVTSTGNLLVGRSAALGILELGDPDGTAFEADRHYQGANLTFGGIALDPSSGDLFASSASIGNRVFAADDDGAPAPAVVLEPPTSVTENSATLHAKINPGGFGIPLSYRFQISRDGKAWKDVNSNTEVGEGVSFVNVQAQATELLPNTLYQVRVLTTKGFGAGFDVPSVAIVFTTEAIPPTVMGLGADSISDTSARITARVNANSSPTSYHFEYGVSGFENSVPVPAGTLDGPDLNFVAQQLSGLAPSTTYQFRVVASSAEGSTTSPTENFTTRATPAPEADRAFELVSPASKISGIGVGVTYTSPSSMGPSGFAARDGDRFAVGSSYGSMLLDANYAFANDYAFADRVSDSVGWRSHTPFSRPLYNFQPTRFINPVAATSDLGRLTWLANGPAPLFPELAALGNSIEQLSYVSDWGALLAPTRWEMLNQTNPVNQQASTQSAAPTAFSADGHWAVLETPWAGLAGSTDPALDALSKRSVYRRDVATISDEFVTSETPDLYTLVNACTGEGADRTEIPRRLAGGKFSAQACDSAPSGRDERLISPYGAGATVPSSLSLPKSAISGDGSRVFFMAPDLRAGSTNPGNLACASGGGDVDLATKCPAQLYVRQLNEDGSETVRWLSRPVASLLGNQQASLLGPAVFEGASADGSRVLFRTNSPLTADDPNGQALTPTDPRPILTGSASGNSWDLYEFKLAPGPDGDPATPDGDPTGPGSSLTRITGGASGNLECNNPQGSPNSSLPAGSAPAATLRFLSEDGTRAYFVCSPPLGSPSDPWNAPPEGGITTPSGVPGTVTETNLYLYDENQPAAQHYRFVARLPRAVNLSIAAPLTDTFRSCATTGERLLSPLNTDNGGGPFANQDSKCVEGTDDGSFLLFWTPGKLTADDPDPASLDVYAYDADSDRLERITAPQRPGGEQSYLCTVNSAGSAPCNATPITSSSRVPALSLVTDPGEAGERLAFFQTRSRLVVTDTDEALDVYEWRDGRLALVTTGPSGANDGAVFMGADETGRNAYFVTRDRMTWQDVDSVADVYVARRGSEGIAEPLNPPLCDVLADACQGVSPAVPPASPAGSGSISGQGNLSPAPKRCAKGKVRRGGKCVAKKPHKKQTKKKRANANGRAHR